MLVEFEDDDLRRLYTRTDCHLAWMGSDLVKQFRRKIALVAAAPDERDLRAMRSLRLEKLAGNRTGHCSIRLNDKWRLIFRLRTENDQRIAVITEVVDYH